MKIRNGFVSNSSSSSFVVLCKDKSLSFDELFKRNVEVFSKNWDMKYDYEREYVHKKANKYANDGEYIMLSSNVEYGAEVSVETIVVRLAKILKPELHIRCVIEE